MTSWSIKGKPLFIWYLHCVQEKKTFIAFVRKAFFFLIIKCELRCEWKNDVKESDLLQTKQKKKPNIFHSS